MAKRSCLPLLLPLLLLARAATATPTDVAVRLPDGRAMNVWCAGSGAPLVLMDAGWRADSRAWGRVIGPLSSRTWVCALDRAGSGRSDPGPLPRDVAAVGRDLAAVADLLSPTRPVVLVGHSSGGLYARQATLARPERVAALVLVDPTLEQQRQQLEARFGAGAGSLAGGIARARACLAVEPGAPREDCGRDPPDLAATRWAARLSELEALEADRTPVPAAGALGALPVVVLSAGRPPGAVADFWREAHGALAALSSAGRLIPVPDSGHLIPRDRPDAVVNAVRDVLDRLEPGRRDAGRGAR
jgi:pimeloyl-ACP methyl ester carboxylesterase